MKSIVQNLCKKLLIGVFKMDDFSQMNVSNWEGKISHQNLELDPSVFDNFNVTLSS
jgi:hypothetical protein